MATIPKSDTIDPYIPHPSDIDSLPLFRILREPNNQDGWIARNVPSNRVAYIRNLSKYIMDIEPGQVWEAEVYRSMERYDVIELLQLKLP